MPPKKRKIDTALTPEPKDGESGSLDTANVEVKTERLSQEEVKNTAEESEEKPAAGRSLRPRKSTCYAEKESPEIDYEEKQKKVPLRRKRRNGPIEDGSQERDSKKNRPEKRNEDGTAIQSENGLLSVTTTEQDRAEGPTLVSATLNSENASDKQSDGSRSADGTAVVPGSDKSNPKPTEKKRVRKKPKPKPTTTEIAPIDATLVPKTEPLSPTTRLVENKENSADGAVENRPVDTAATVPAKPKPRKRIRNKKPVVADKGEDKTVDGLAEQPIIKQEVVDDDDTGKKESSQGESKTDSGGKEGEENDKPVAPPKKRPAKKKKPPAKKDPLESNSEKTEADDTSKASNNNELSSLLEGTEVKVEGDTIQQGGENGNQKESVAVKKRPRSRPKKPATATKKSTTDDGDGKGATTEEKSNVDGESEEKKKIAENPADQSNEPAAVKPPVVRKPFFRGRRSKSISARSGRKEIIHMEETINPEDIRGFEHVEKYATPEGVRLPKFWDSEDEMSDDENNDNFRRIMCGFGTNCRIHEVIRPASEIVRRLKELQNTFGATKSLPLFQKDELDSNEGAMLLTSSEPFLRRDRDRTITWHTDPSFFKYANNYPSKCK